MTYTISRADALAAIEGERLTDGTGTDDDAAYNRALDDAIAAINALPGVQVTDDMAHRAQQKLPIQIGASVIFPSIDEVRAALEAAFHDAPCGKD